jgi:acyl-CoA synthetase (NDP forming)
MTEPRPALAAMLDARSIAVVGASARPGSFGARMVTEVGRGDAGRTVHLINSRYAEIGGVECRPSLKELDGPVDLVLLGVGDASLASQLAEAARIGARSAVIFGSANGEALRASLRGIAMDAGMALCGAGCMGFANVAAGVRALGYIERAVIPAGPVSLVTHSGSVFSALLRTRRALGYTLAVSSGQELVTTTADYLDYILDHTDTGLIALVLETVREGGRLRAALHRAASRDVPVVVLPVGGSPLGSAMVAAHSGAVAGDHAMWDALCDDTAMLRVGDLAELTDTIELLTLARRPGRRVGGIATIHDSGAERSLVADLAHELDVPFALLADETLATVGGLLDEGLLATNPLDLWGSGADSRELFGGCLRAMAADPNVAVAALAVDLVTEYDDDTSYADAVLDVASASSSGPATGSLAPIAVLTNLPSALDEPTAARLRAAGVPVLEGTRSGLVALRHLLSSQTRGYRPPSSPVVDAARCRRWLARLAAGPLDASTAFELLGDYGLATVATRAARTRAEAIAAAAELGYPVAHKSDVGGVVLAIATEAQLAAAYDDLTARLGPRVSVSATAPAGVEVSVGMVRDPQVGPMIVLAAGGVFMELLTDRAVALPPVSPERARELIDRLRLRVRLAGWRGSPAADLDALVAAITAMSQLALELGDVLDAVDVNPVIASPTGAIAVDALVAVRGGTIRGNVAH